MGLIELTVPQFCCNYRSELRNWKDSNRQKRFVPSCYGSVPRQIVLYRTVLYRAEHATWSGCGLVSVTMEFLSNRQNISHYVRHSGSNVVSLVLPVNCRTAYIYNSHCILWFLSELLLPGQNTARYRWELLKSFPRSEPLELLPAATWILSSISQCSSNTHRDPPYDLDHNESLMR